MSIVIDEAWYQMPVSEAEAHGVVAVSMYVGQDTTGKNMNPARVNAYASAGIKIITNFEYGSTQATAGSGQGASDARLGLSQADACGMPGWAPIIFSVDEAASPQSVAPYFAGAKSVLGLERVGVYGDYNVVRGMISGGLARWGWQTVAWSNGQVDSGQIFMYQNAQTIGSGADIDVIEADISHVAWLPGEKGPTPPPPTQWTVVSLSMQVPVISQTNPGPNAEFVEFMQGALNARAVGGGAARLAVDGSFGPATTARLNEFKGNHALPKNGVCDANTWKALV